MSAKRSFLPKEEVRAVLQKAFASNTRAQVEFIKRSTGELRQMTCAAVPPSQLRATARADLDAAGANTLFVWDVEKKKPASLPAEAVLRVVLEGEP